jgi:enterochelin esterase family protein
VTIGHLPPELVAAAADHERFAHELHRRGGAPLLDAGVTTFLYLGDAEAVGLHHWMDIFPRLPEFVRRPGTDLWTLTIELPTASRIEYKLSVKQKGRRRLILDPFNPRRARDPFGTNSLAIGPGYERPAWSLPAGAPPGSIDSFPVESAAFGDERRAALYLPARSANGPHPLLVVHDGSEYVEYAALGVVLDNLIDAGEIPPVVGVLSDPGDRMTEYRADRRHADHLVEELIPAVADRVEIDAAAVVSLGASLGGVASLHAARRHPGVFAGLILQSGSFVTALGGPHRRGKVFEPVVEFMAGFNDDPGSLPRRIHVSCGRFDGLIGDNRLFVRRLRDRGVEVGYEEAPDGHHWGNWRNRLRAGLRYTLAGSVDTGKEATS